MQGDETDEELKERLRFEVELEFVQCLSNPRYLNYLAQRLTLEEPSFLAYLEYLQYWKQPQYAKFIQYPRKLDVSSHAASPGFVAYRADPQSLSADCLYLLELLQDKAFRQQLKNQQFAEYVHVQQFYHWQYLHSAATSKAAEPQEGKEASH
jgi:mediator of RNA polymerase II transcription subunit 31